VISNDLSEPLNRLKSDLVNLKDSLGDKKIAENSMLSKHFKTVKVPLIVKKIMALKRAIRKNILTPQILTSIKEGKTHEAYL
jgi:hypothetical protein